MCGIAGAFVPGGPSARLEAEVAAMTASVTHRGPDAEGIWTDPDAGVGLGHRRLQIVGLGPEGAQPMTSRSGRWVLTYNGEIYDAPAVGRRLEGEGVRFRGSSDTEVVVEAIDAWGPAAALEALDGMHALAAWDRQERRLVLARDRLGEKPLAYTPFRGGVAFASELRALRTLPDFDPTIDPDAVVLFLRFKYVPAPWTIHRGTRKVPPGTWIEVAADGTIGDPQAYWSLDEVLARPAPPTVGDDVALDALDDVLGRAVASRMRSDVPLGAFLSGGIDSTIVATYAAEASTRPLQTFTIGSPDRDHDESDQARGVAERLGADHTELVVTPEDALAEVPGLAEVWDEPFADSSQVPTLLVSRLARSRVTVALSGDGGDELFGGYNRHLWLPRTWGRVGRVPGGVRRAAGRALTRPSPAAYDRLAQVVPERRRPRLVGLKAHKLGGVLGARDETDAYGFLVSHWQDPAALVRGAHEPSTLTHRRADWPGGRSLAEQLMAVDAQTYLPDDVLVKVDRASMSVSLEARVPLLAREVVEHAAGMPLDRKIRDGRGKWALRELLARRHPREAFERPKSGFGIPIALWLRGPLRPWAEDLLAERNLRATGLLDPVPVRRAWDEHQSGRRDRSYDLWDVLQLVSWLEQNRP